MRLLILLVLGFASVAEAKAFYNSDTKEAVIIVNGKDGEAKDEFQFHSFNPVKVPVVLFYKCKDVTRSELKSSSLAKSRTCVFHKNFQLKTLGWRVEKLQALLKPIALETLDGRAIDETELRSLRDQLALQSLPTSFRDLIASAKASVLFDLFKNLGTDFDDENGINFPAFKDSEIIAMSATELTALSTEAKLLDLSDDFHRSVESVWTRTLDFRKIDRFAKEKPVLDLRATAEVNDCDVDVFSGSYVGSVGNTQWHEGGGLYPDTPPYDYVSSTYQVVKLGAMPGCVQPRKRVLASPWLTVTVVNNTFTFIWTPGTEFDQRNLHWEKR